MNVDPVTIGIIGTFLVFFLIFIGMPIAFALMLIGFAGITYLTLI
jgi:hypothetical protein